MQFMGAGIAGLQGPMYIGTNCFHRRKVIYGLSPDGIENDKKGLAFIFHHWNIRCNIKTV